MLMRHRLSTLWSRRFMMVQLLSFFMGKLCFLLVQLPSQQKQSAILSQLVLASLFYTLGIAFKIIQHKQGLIKQLPNTLCECYLPLVMGLMVMMFEFVLEDKLRYSFLQKMLTMLTILLQITNLILQCNPKFINKTQMIFYTVVLTLNIFALAQKCIWFLTYEDDELKVKDILLLNLTTQIALSILFIQYLSQTYKQHLSNQILQMKQQSLRIEKELQMNA